jgi:tetratricopeptide (TPR) repeat protein
MVGPLFTNKTNDEQSKQDWRLRNAFAISVLLASLHGIVDVPNHTPGYGLLSALMLGLALRNGGHSQAGRTLVLGNRLMGVLILVFGSIQLCIALGNPIVPGLSSARLLAEQARIFSSSGRSADALQSINGAIAMNPLDWTHYFQRAQVHLNLKDSESKALMDFGRARAIQPHLSRLCFVEGQIWKNRNPDFAIAAWAEVLRRHPTDANAWYQAMLGECGGSSDFSNGLAKLARTPMQKLAYLSWSHAYDRSSTDGFKERLATFVSDPRNIDSLDLEGRMLLFRIWSQHGDRSELVRRLESNLVWQQDGWQILCNEYARDGKYEEAIKMAKRYELPPTSPSITGLMPVNQLEQNFLFNPTDARRGIDLYFGYKSRGEWTQALATLEKVAALPTAPNYLSYEMASIYAEKEDFRRAWELMLQYLSRPK